MILNNMPDAIIRLLCEWHYIMVSPTEPRELAHEAPCLVTMLMILETENKHLEDRWRDPGVTLEVILLVNWTLSPYSLYITRFGPCHVSRLLQTHPETIYSSKRCSCSQNKEAERLSEALGQLTFIKTKITAFNSVSSRYTTRQKVCGLPTCDCRKCHSNLRICSYKRPPQGRWNQAAGICSHSAIISIIF